MGLTCTALFCKNSSPRDSKFGISFHRFPKDPVLRSAWLKVCHAEYVMKRDDRLCSEHFDNSAFMIAPQNRKRRLNPGAVPVWKFGNGYRIHVANSASDEIYNTAKQTWLCVSTPWACDSNSRVEESSEVIHEEEADFTEHESPGNSDETIVVTEMHVMMLDDAQPVPSSEREPDALNAHLPSSNEKNSDSSSVSLAKSLGRSQHDEAGRTERENSGMLMEKLLAENARLKNQLLKKQSENRELRKKIKRLQRANRKLKEIQNSKANRRSLFNSMVKNWHKRAFGRRPTVKELVHAFHHSKR